ncbi:MAG: hypothetical protein HY617_00405 [Candidatus Sungbacteria bacterium]|nr:hypothetical protein [Candidatus Sungbacteria bacterium]
MLIDILLGIIFVGSCYMIWHRISEKIPQVVAIPDEVITQRLHENSARLRIFLLHFKTFYKEEYYLNLFWSFWGKVFYKLHIFVLRLDNYIISILKKIRARNGFSGLFISEQVTETAVPQKASIADKKKSDGYWNVLKENTPAASMRTVQKRSVEGVRVRVRKTSAKTAVSREHNRV